ncbi:MAG: LysR substrate-binding domain-containing protein [Desulfoplanes sp.]|nr:LysR substrate-binding domain-containing protein [Desulfoplanes sp.]MDD4650410.1 LysR substrate-binding domain-containing protein [Desulfoplanes sp.]
MELRNIHALVEVVRQGGFSAAAKVLYTSQPNVSKAVRQLQDELGIQLLERNGHKSALTEAGQIVYRRAMNMLAESEDMLAELDELRGLRRGVLRLGLPLLGSSVLFASIFAVFRSRYPGIEIRLVEHGSKKLEELLRAGEIDLAASLFPVSQDFDWQDVRNEPFVALVPSNHRLAAQPSIQLKMLAADPFILFEEGFLLNKLILGYCACRGFQPTVAAHSGQIDFIVGLVKAGLGIALLPRLMAEQRLLPGVAFIALDEPDISWHMVMLWRNGGFLPHAARAWLELSKEVRTD